MGDLISQAEEIAREEQEKTGMPVLLHIEHARNVGKMLADDLDADRKIVEIGCLMMDCMIGKAIQEGKVEEHIEISAKRTEEWLDGIDIDPSIKANILACVREHHGVPEFHSLESEICCNADCYRFVSVKGFAYGFRYLRDMEFTDLVKLLKGKVEEKWNALTLEICKKELLAEHETIMNFLKNLDSGE